MANIISQLVAFSGSIIYVHLMNQQQFGIYAFAYTIISFFLLLNGFGAASGVLQFVSAAKNELEGLAYFKYALRLGVVFNGGLALGIFLYATFIPIPLNGAAKALYLMALFPIGRLYIDVVQAYLRATCQNHRLAKFAISVNLILLFINIGGIYWNGLIGFIVSTYIAYIIIISLSIFVYKLPNVFNLQVPLINQKRFMGYSVYIAFGNAFSQLLFILDIIILGYIIRDAHTVAIYKVATVIPFSINFIPGIVSSFFYPYFAKNAANLNYIMQLKRQLQQKMFIFSFIVSLLLIIMAKPIITIIFGEIYQESIIPFQILSFGFWILATFRNINGNILASLGQAKFAMWLNIGIVIINIILTCILVTHFGIIGAAIGVVIIYILSSMIAAIVLNRILLRG
ncbi:MAG: oligosaccharide flippase family protein [Burkholderiales bacterium]|nr:oligosaccharide flippase family protein [Burkholderiales bacterium]